MGKLRRPLAVCIGWALLVPSVVLASQVDDTTQLSFGAHRFDPVSQAEDYRSGRSAASGKGLRFVQFHASPTEDMRGALIGAGLNVIQYYPHNAYLVWGDDAAGTMAENNAFVRWQGLVSPDWKLAPDLKGRLGPVKNVQILVYDDGNVSNVAAQIAGLGGTVLNSFNAQPDGQLKTLIVALDAGQLVNMANIAQVLWAEYVGDKPIFDDELSSQIVAGNYNASNLVTTTGYIASVAGLGLTGAGVRWAITDSGIDYANPELGSRIVAGHDFPSCPVTASQPGNDNSAGGHGTHVAGIVGGAGTIAGGTDANGFHYGIGVAPQVQLVALNPICVGAVPWPPAGGWQENSRQAILRQAVGTNNSWTSAEGTNIGYNATARTHDFMVRDGNFDTPTVNDPFMIVFSAGNSGPNANTLTSPKEAKSPIIVAASRNQRVGSIDAMAGFSSRGPAVDGRTLPTVAAPGEQIASTRRVAGASQCGTAIGASPLNNFSFCSGTSMAAPHVAGAAALLTQWWRGNNAGATPSPAMIKALLVNGAIDMSGVAGFPNSIEGWGRIHLPNAIGQGVQRQTFDQSEVLTEPNAVFERIYGVPDSTKPVRVTLAWSDAPGAAGANPALVNNLDLEVIAGGQTYLGNVFASGVSTTGGSADNRNPVENVYLPAGVGSVTLRVKATALPGDGVPNFGDATDQDFALVCSNCVAEPGFSVSMPTTGESICAGTPITREISVGQILGFVSPVALASTGLPSPGSVAFVPASVTPPGTSTMTANTTGVATGNHSLTVTGTSGSLIRTASFPLFVANTAPAPSALSAPSNNATGVVPTGVALTWAASPEAFDYVVQVASDAAFANILHTTTTRETNWTIPSALNTSTQYFWRVISRNACSAVEMFQDGFEDPVPTGVPSATFAFTTQSAPGDCPAGPAPTIVLSENFDGPLGAGWGQQAGGSGTNTWAVTNFAPFGGSGLSLRATAPTSVSDQRYVSPTVALPTVGNGLSLTFQSRHAIEIRTTGANCFDAAILEVSTDGGTSFVQVPNAQLQTDPYNAPVDAGFSNPLAGVPAWCGTQPFTRNVVDLSPYAGQTAQFRFRLTSDSSANLADGWIIDNIELKRCN